MALNSTYRPLTLRSAANLAPADSNLDPGITESRRHNKLNQVCT